MPSLIEIAACHEADPAVTARAFGVTVRRASIGPRGASRGREMGEMLAALQ
jgi:membrane-associated protease RseP (regulator of RpoE activity)